MLTFKSKPCRYCEQVFTPKGTRSQWCSARCKMDDSYVVCPSGCWMWTGMVDKNGYGKVRIDGRSAFASRVAYEVWVGPIQLGMCVLHVCDNPGCINPKHLFLGTRQDNMADKVAKGRQYRGEAHWKTQLTENDVREIRQNPCSQRKIAATYGLSRSSIQGIKNGKRWRHVVGCELTKPERKAP